MNTSRLNVLSYRSQQNLFCRCPDAKANFGSKLIPLTMQLEVLSQLQDGRWHPIAYLSKSLNETQRNYEIYDKEMLAIMLALEEWRHYLIGAIDIFEIWTD